MKRPYKTILFLITPILATLLFILPILAFAEHYRIIRVVDSDTILVDYRGKNEKVIGRIEKSFLLLFFKGDVVLPF